MANVEVESVDALRRRLVIEVPAQDVTREIDRAFSELGQTASVRGFRRGRVPRKVLEKVAGDQLRAEVFEKLVHQTYHDALHEEKIEPVGRPEIVSESPAQSGEPLRYSVTVEVKPEIALGRYDGIAAERPLRTITDEDVEALMENVRQSAARVEPVEDRDVSCAGDVVTVDYHVREGETSMGRAENRMIEVGGDDRLELGWYLDEAEVGSDVHFDIDFPADFHNPSIAGKTLTFEVLVRSIGSRIVPPLDDDFAKSYGGYESLDEMRRIMRQSMEERAMRSADDTVRSVLIESLLREHDFEVPHSMVAQRAESMADEALADMRERRPPASREWEVREQLCKEVEPRAREQVRANLLLEAIAAAEGIEVSESEIDAEIAEIVQGAGAAADRARALYRDTAARMALRVQLMRQRALDQVVEKANVQTVEENSSVAGNAKKG